MSSASSNSFKPDLAKTKMCKFFEVGCKNTKCSFAHSKEELRPVFCRFGDKCVNEKCWFYHDDTEVPSQDELFCHALQELSLSDEKEKNKSIGIKQVESKRWKNLLEDMKKEEENVDEEIKVVSDTKVSDTKEKKMRVTFEAFMTQDEMVEIMKLLRSKKVDPSIVSLQ